MASEPLVLASGGAGYDDQNNNGYGNGDDVGEDVATEPTCDSGKHEIELFPSVL
jgi:hypothetical protein